MHERPEGFTDLSDRGSTGHNTDGAASADQHGLARRQTAYNDSEDSAESDVNWEEVDLVEDVQVDNTSANAQALNLVLGDTGESKQNLHQSSKKRPATSAERKLKLEIHKMHVLCLLAHVYLRNHWCNDDEVHVGLD